MPENPWDKVGAPAPAPAPVPDEEPVDTQNPWDSVGAEPAPGVATPRDAKTSAIMDREREITQERQSALPDFDQDVTEEVERIMADPEEVDFERRRLGLPSFKDADKKRLDDMGESFRIRAAQEFMQRRMSGPIFSPQITERREDTLGRRPGEGLDLRKAEPDMPQTPEAIQKSARSKREYEDKALVDVMSGRDIKDLQLPELVNRAKQMQAAGILPARAVAEADFIIEKAQAGDYRYIPSSAESLRTMMQDAADKAEAEYQSAKTDLAILRFGSPLAGLGFLNAESMMDILGKVGLKQVGVTRSNLARHRVEGGDLLQFVEGMEQIGAALIPVSRAGNVITSKILATTERVGQITGPFARMSVKPAVAKAIGQASAWGLFTAGTQPVRPGGKFLDQQDIADRIAGGAHTAGFVVFVPQVAAKIEKYISKLPAALRMPMSEAAGMMTYQFLTDVGTGKEFSWEDFRRHGLPMALVFGVAKIRQGRDADRAKWVQAREKELIKELEFEIRSERPDAEVPERGPYAEANVVVPVAVDPAARGTAEISEGKLAISTDVVRGEPEPTRRRAGSEAGFVDLTYKDAVKGILESLGVVKKLAVDTPLMGGDMATRLLAKQIGKIPMTSGGKDAFTLKDIVTNVIPERFVPWWRKGPEWRSQVATYQRSLALARDDAKAAMRDLVRIPETKEALDPKQQSAAVEWFSGNISDADLAARTSPGYVETAKAQRAKLAQNQKALRDSGWLSEDTFKEWENKWIPRLFEVIEERAGGGRLTGQKGRGIPKVFRRRDRYDVFQTRDGKIREDSDRIVASFKTMEEAADFVQRQQAGEQMGVADRKAMADSLREQAQVQQNSLPDEVIGIRGQRATQDGVDGVRVTVETSDGRRSKKSTRFFEDPVEAEKYEMEQKSLRNQRKRLLDEIATLEREAAKIEKGEAAPTTQDLMIREPLSFEQRMELREIRDPAVLVARGLVTQTMTLQTIKYLDTISANPTWASPRETKEHTVQFADNPKKWGKLAGMWMHPSLARDIQGMFTSTRGLAQKMGEISDALLSQWKMGTTAWRIPTHFRNIYGNTIFAELDGMSFLDPGNLKHFAEAVKIMRARPGDAREETRRFLIREGVMGGDYLSTEVMDMARDVVMYRGRTFHEKVNNYVAEKFGHLKEGRVLEAIPVASDLGKALSWLYRVEDILPKVASYVSKVRGGRVGRARMEPLEAAAEVRANWPQYDELLVQNILRSKTPTASLTRQMIPAFMSFTEAAARIYAKHAVERPFTMAVMATSLIEGTKAALQAIGVEDMDQAARLGLAPYMSIGIPGLTVEEGKKSVLDLTYVVPLGEEVATAIRLLKGEAPDPLEGAGWRSMPTGPFAATVFQLVFNKNLWTGREINTAGGSFFSRMSQPEGRREMFRFALRSLLPPVTPSLGSIDGVEIVGRDVDTLQKAINGVPIDKDGQVKRNVYTTMMNKLLGIDIKAVDFTVQKARRLEALERETAGKIQRLRDIYREARGGRMSPFERDREEGELVEEIIGMVNEGLDLLEEPGNIKGEGGLPKDIRARIYRARRGGGSRGKRDIGKMFGLPGKKRKTLYEALGGGK